MKLYLMRHGKAVNVGVGNVRSDSGRHLSKEGVIKTEMAARRLKNIGCAPKQVFASPLKRALETARIMGSVLCPKKDVEPTEEVRMGFEIEEACLWMKKNVKHDALIVGHMPDMSLTTSYLLTAGFALNIVFKTSSICCISFHGSVRPGSGALEWFADTPLLTDNM